MKSLLLIIGLLYCLTGCSQTIGELYENSKESIVLIKTSESKVVGQGFQKLLFE